MRRWHLLILSLAAAVIGLAGGGAARASLPGSNGSIAYVNNCQIWKMNPDGSSQQQLTSINGGCATDPAWSPDGTTLAFADTGNGAGLIDTVSASGGTPTTIFDGAAHNGEEASHPTWSPDGSKIAFAATTNTGEGDLDVMTKKGKSLTTLLAGNGSVANVSPDWSPDGSRIAFVAQTGFSGGAIETYTLKTGVVSTVTSGPTDSTPSWSPDATQIAFQRNHYPDPEGIYRVAASGGSPTLLSDGSDFDELPSWSPDGSLIAFHTTSSGYDIWTMNAVDGSNRTSLTNFCDCVDSSGISWEALSAIAIHPSTLNAATATVPYSKTLTVSGGTGPYTFSIFSGSLPSGLTLNATTGAISGTPTTAGTSSFTVQATDSSTPTAKAGFKTYSLLVQLDVLPKSLPAASVGTSYDQNLSAAGGTSPYSFALTAGTLPPGLTLGAGSISGTPTATGTYAFTIQATDSSSPTNVGTRNYTLNVGLGLTPDSPLPNALIGEPYSTTVSAVGGSGSYTYALTGSLPPGLSLDANSGTISGTASKMGNASFTITATDGSTGATGSKRYSLDVGPTGKWALVTDDNIHGCCQRDDVTLKGRNSSHGRMSDTDGATGTWSYDATTGHISMSFPSGVYDYEGDWNAQADEFDGSYTGPNGAAGTFVLKAPF